jgi:hypothetical protein
MTVIILWNNRLTEMEVTKVLFFGYEIHYNLDSLGLV